MKSDIIIKQNDGRAFDVHVGDRYADGLTFDEMLGLVASITLPQGRGCLNWLKTEAEHRALREFFPSNELADFEVRQ